MFFSDREQVVLAALLVLVLAGTGLILWQRSVMSREPAPAPVTSAPVAAGEGGERPGLSSGAMPGAGAPAPDAVRGAAAADAGARDAANDQDAGGPAVGGWPERDTASRDVVVHVAGAVRAPGVYALKDGRRVADAVAAAGGPAPDARPDLLNLAARLQDGQKLYVPSERDARAWLSGGKPAGAAPWTASPWDGGGVGGAGATGGAPARVNLNQADAAALDTLPGIGPALAARIVEHRQAHGPFRRVEDVQQVSGIGPSKFQEIRERVTIGP